LFLGWLALSAGEALCAGADESVIEPATPESSDIRRRRATGLWI